MTAFDWNTYFELAKELRNGNEAAQRAAVSRAYYAVFNRARQLVQLEGELISNRGAHEQVLNALGRKRGHLTTSFKRLMLLRVKADYEGENHIVQKDADTAIALAGWLLPEINRQCREVPGA